MTDAAFVRAFEAGAVTPAEFDHRAHLRVAWVYLRETEPFDAALARMRGAILAFATAAGASQKYHETMTVLWMRLLEKVRDADASGLELAAVVSGHPELGDKDLPLQFYSRARLFSEEARAQWVEPDLDTLGEATE